VRSCVKAEAPATSANRQPAAETLSPPPQEMDLYSSLLNRVLVPKKGLEPPHPCEYVDLNHARLPIPPLRHVRLLRRVAPSGQQL
jgi:hypothetical protein